MEESQVLRCPTCRQVYAVDGIMRHGAVWHVRSNVRGGVRETCLQCKKCERVFTTGSAAVAAYVHAAVTGRGGSLDLKWFVETASYLRKRARG